MTFTKTQTTEIQTSIKRALARAVNKYPIVRASADDISQDAWIKILTGYNAALGHAPAAFAYTVTTTIAIDYARNRGAKLRMGDLVSSADAPVSADEDSATLIDTLASDTLDPAATLHARQRASAVQTALATLSETQRDALADHDGAATGAQRVAKKRAIESLQEVISARL